MSKIYEYFNGLFHARSFEDFKSKVDYLTNIGNYEASAAFRKYLKFCNINENKDYIVKNLSQFKDSKLIRKLLFDMSYVSSRVLKETVIKTMTKSGDPWYAYRLYFLYINTSNVKFKSLVINYYLKTGIFVFCSKLAWGLEKDHFNNQLDVLYYVASMPYLDDSAVKSVEEKLPVLFESAAAHSSIRKLLFYLHLIHQKRSFKKSIIKKNVLHYENYLASPVNTYALFFSEMTIERQKIPSGFWKNFFEKPETAHPGNFFSYPENRQTILDKIPELLEKASLEGPVLFERILKRLLPLSSPALFEILFMFLKSTDHYVLKEKLIDVMRFITPDEKTKPDFLEYLKSILSDISHKRIFEHAASALIVMYRHNGLDVVSEAFGKIGDFNHKTHLMAGINDAVIDFGYGIKLTHLDQYYLQMILSNAFFTLEEDSAGEKRRLFEEVCRFIEFTGNDTFSSEFFHIIGRYSLSEFMINAAVYQGRKEAVVYIKKHLQNFIDDKFHHAFWVHQLFHSASSNKLSHPEYIDSEILKAYLITPVFAVCVIHFLTEHRLFHFADEIMKYGDVSHQLLVFRILRYFHEKRKVEQSSSATEAVREIFNHTSCSFLKKAAGAVLINTENSAAIKDVYEFYFKGGGSGDDFRWILSHMKKTFSVISENYKIVAGYKDYAYFSYFEEAAGSVSLDLVHLIKNHETNIEKNPEVLSPEIEEMRSRLPESVYSVIYTGEKLYTLYLNSSADQTTRFDVETIYNEFRKSAALVLFLIIRNYVENLFENEQFLKSLKVSFIDGKSFVNFFKSEQLWRSLKFKENILEEIRIMIIEKQKEKLLHLLNSEIYAIHLLGMTLIENPFYSINNPLNVPLKFFHQNRIPDRLGFFLLDVHERKMMGKEKILSETRHQAFALCRFMAEFQEVYLG